MYWPEKILRKYKMQMQIGKDRHVYYLKSIPESRSRSLLSLKPSSLSISLPLEWSLASLESLCRSIAGLRRNPCLIGIWDRASPVWCWIGSFLGSRWSSIFWTKREEKPFHFRFQLISCPVRRRNVRSSCKPFLLFLLIFWGLRRVLPSSSSVFELVFALLRCCDWLTFLVVWKCFGIRGTWICTKIVNEMGSYLVAQRAAIVATTGELISW